MFAISADWPQNAKFVLANIYTKTLEFVDLLPFRIQSQILVHTNCVLDQNHRKMYLQMIVTLKYVYHIINNLFE